MDPLRHQIESRRDALIRLTQDLIRIPTLNPPGRHYLDICEYLRGRLAPQGWDCALVRAKGSPGDSEAFPRWNLVARHHGASPGDWLISERVEAAKSLLSSDDLAIEGVAAAVGFGSAHALRHHFRRKVGLTPTEYRSRFLRVERRA